MTDVAEATAVRYPRMVVAANELVRLANSRLFQKFEGEGWAPTGYSCLPVPEQPDKWVVYLPLTFEGYHRHQQARAFFAIVGIQRGDWAKGDQLNYAYTAPTGEVTIQRFHLVGGQLHRKKKTDDKDAMLKQALVAAGLTEA